MADENILKRDANYVPVSGGVLETTKQVRPLLLNEVTGYLKTEIPALDQATDSVSVGTQSTIYNGQKNVTTAGTRVALASSQAVVSVSIKAKITNTGYIYVGNATVSSSNGFLLMAGESISLDISDLATVYLDSSVNGEGVYYLAII